MVQINLLPLSAKRKQKEKIELQMKMGPVVFSAAGIIFAVIALWVILAARLSLERGRLSGLEEKLKTVEVTLERLNSLEAEKEQIENKLAFLNEALKAEVLWSKNLNRISNLLPAGIWLKKMVLNTEQERGLDLYTRLDVDGSVISLQGEEMIDLIGNFMSAIKEDTELAPQFSEVKLVSSQRSKIGKIEVMNFKLLCGFR